MRLENECYSIEQKLRGQIANLIDIQNACEHTRYNIM